MVRRRLADRAGGCMTLQGLRKTVTAGIATTSMAVALMVGFSPAIAHADVLDDIANEYAHGAGTGPLANLVVQSMKLRAMGFKPSQGNYDAINKALVYKPNQTPLIKALQDTVASQTKLQKEASLQQGNNQNQVGFGINQYNPANPGGVTFGQGGVNIGGGPWQIGGQPGSVVGPPVG
jgi:hypothetical protein